VLKQVALTVVMAAAIAIPITGQTAESSKPAGSRPRMGDTQTLTMTATVQAIDTATRELTLKDTDGEVSVIAVPEEVKRFSAIKVGDHLKVRYTEAIVFEVHKADAAAKVGTKVDRSFERKAGDKPSGVITRTIEETVEVVSVDTKTPAITVRSANGKSHSYRVQDAKNLNGVSAGDKIAVTYSEAVAVDVTSPPAK
jgi:FlaG/FlaF family flagellin (archaellin)